MLLEDRCERIFQEYRAGVYIVTVEDFGGGDIQEWQRLIFEEYDDFSEACGGNGVMLAISMAERDWGLVAFGTAQDAFSTYRRERIGELILDDLSDGEYCDAFLTYVSIAEDYYEEAEEGTPYKEEYRYNGDGQISVIVLVSFLLSLIVSLMIVLSWKRSMNTRVPQSGAMGYLKDGSFRLYQQSDQFLYHLVRKTERQKESSSGSSGGTRSGSGGGSRPRSGGGSRSGSSRGTMHSSRSGTSGKF